MNDMRQFVTVYIPGGMGLDHSAWWVVCRTACDGMVVEIPIVKLRNSDYT